MGMEERAFRPLGVSQNLAVTAGAASITLNVTAGTRAVRIVNNGTTAVWFAVDTTATTTQGQCMLGNTVESFTVGKDATFISFISTGAAGTVYVTTGEGI